MCKPGLMEELKKKNNIDNLVKKASNYPSEVEKDYNRYLVKIMEEYYKEVKGKEDDKE